MSQQKTEQAFEKPAPAAHPIHELIAHRWSPRSFSEQPVDRQLLAQLFEAARWSPSSSNEQPWAFVVAERGTEGWQKLFETLVPFNQAWVKTAPVLVLGLARKTFAGDGRPNEFALYDLGQAMGALLVEATALGLSVHQMAGFDAARARLALNVPETHHVAATFVIGYAADPSLLPSEGLRQRETAPRQRQPIENFVFEGEFAHRAEFPPSK